MREWAEVGHGPVQVDEVEQVFDEPGTVYSSIPNSIWIRPLQIDLATLVNFC